MGGVESRPSFALLTSSRIKDTRQATTSNGMDRLVRCSEGTVRRLNQASQRFPPISRLEARRRVLPILQPRSAKTAAIHVARMAVAILNFTCLGLSAP